LYPWAINKELGMKEWLNGIFMLAFGGFFTSSKKKKAEGIKFILNVEF
jgi:hypothetical protein